MVRSRHRSQDRPKTNNENKIAQIIKKNCKFVLNSPEVPSMLSLFFVANKIIPFTLTPGQHECACDRKCRTGVKRTKIAWVENEGPTPTKHFIQ